MQAILSNSKRLRWFLTVKKPCSDSLLLSIIKNLSALEAKVSDVAARLSAIIPLITEEVMYRAPMSRTGQVGRPQFIIPKEQLEVMRGYRLSWMDIARALGVSISTLWRLRKKYDIDIGKKRKARTVSEQELEGIILELQQTSPNIGIRMIEGEIISRGLYAARSNIANKLVEMDPVGRVLQWSRQNPRTKYHVPGPNSLWHLDGNHKLIRWRLVIHGGIDGFSRLVVFLKCSINNRAKTVAHLFLGATEEFCWPSRVRTDKGGENQEVARLMLDRRGEGRGSIIQGSSVHNQRIERLWRDMRDMVTEYFRKLFFFLEDEDILCPDNDIDLFALHYIFLPRINFNLEKFKNSWNNHKLSTENQKTPNQLYLLGMLRLFGSDYIAVKDFFEDNTIDEDTYGIYEPDPGVAEEMQDDEIERVVVPAVSLQVGEACWNELQSVDPLQQDHNHGIPSFIQAKAIIARHVR
ncbi:uncharacterized protein LOC125559006 [Nematostella vectensis]|uniref:uncharacterized protein LOC125559006 n=1 Tax=Nematostella vectensis TaxID=45351 RepID=UPI0020773BA1|nr:uncharacterized protein LOC125559006 [Nematostella vectensis]